MKKNKAPQASKLDQQKTASSQKVTVEQNDHHVNDVMHASLAASTQGAHLSKKLGKNLQPKADKASDHLPGDANATDLQDAYAAIDKQLSDSDNMQFLAAASGDASASANATNNKGDKDKVVINHDNDRGSNKYLLWLLGGGLLAGGVAAAASGGGGSSSPTPPPAPGKITDFNTFCDNAVTSGGLLTSLKTFNVNLTSVPTGGATIYVDEGWNRPNAVTGISPTDWLNTAAYAMSSYGVVGTGPGTTLKAAGLAVVLQNNLDFANGIDFHANVDLITGSPTQDKVLWMHEVSIKTTADTGLTDNVEATLDVSASATNYSDAEIGICEVVIDVSGQTDAFASANIFASAFEGASARVIIEDLVVKASVYNQGASTAYYGGTAEARIDSITASASQSAEAHVTVDTALVSAYLGEYGVGGQALADMGRENADIGAYAQTTGSTLAAIPTGSGISEASITIGHLDIRAESNAVSSEAKASMALGLGKDYFTSYTTSASGSATNVFTNRFDSTLNIEAQSTGDQNFVLTTSDLIPGLSTPATDTIYIDQELNASVTIGNLDISATANRGNSLAEASMASDGNNVQAKIFAHGTADEVGLTELRTATIDIDNINITAKAKMFAADAHAVIATSAYHDASFTIEAHADENSQTSITIGDINVTATAGLPNATAEFDSFGFAAAGLAGNANGDMINADGDVEFKAFAHTSTSGALPSADLTIGNINIEAHSQFTEGTANNHDFYNDDVYNRALAFVAANADDLDFDIRADSEGQGAEAAISINQINVIATAESSGYSSAYATAFLVGNDDGNIEDSKRADIDISAEATDYSTADLTIQSIKVSASADIAKAYMIHNAEDAEIEFRASATSSSGSGFSTATLNLLGNLDIKATGENFAEAAMFGDIEDAASLDFVATASLDSQAYVTIGNINIQATAEGSANAAIVTDVNQDNSDDTQINFKAYANDGIATVTIGSVNVDATGNVASAALISNVNVYSSTSSASNISVDIQARATDAGGDARVDIGAIHVEASGYEAIAGGILDITRFDGDVNAEIFIGAITDNGDNNNADLELDTFEVIARGEGIAQAMLVGSISDNSSSSDDALHAEVMIEAYSSNKGVSNVDIGTLRVEAHNSVENSDYVASITKAFMAGEVSSSNSEIDDVQLSAGVDIRATAINDTNSVSLGRDTTSNILIDDIIISAESEIGAADATGYFTNFNVASAFMAGGVSAGATGYGGPFNNQNNLAGTASVDINALSNGTSKASIAIGDINIIADIQQTIEGSSSSFGEDGFVQSRAFMAGDARDNHVDIHATASASGYSGDQSEASVTINNINIKATSNAQGLGKIDAFVVGASGYDQNFADLTISAFNDAGATSAANVDIGTLNVTASSEAGSTTLITHASLVNVGGFFGAGEDGSVGSLLIGARNYGFQSTANVDIAEINVNANAIPSASGYAAIANANLVGAETAYARMGASVSGSAKSADASLHIGDIKVSAEGALFNYAVGVQGQDIATLSIAAVEDARNSQATVTIGNIEVNASMPSGGANSFLSASGYVNIAALASGQDANVNIYASSYGDNVGSITNPDSLASLSIDQIKVTADGSGYLNLAALQFGEEARGVIGAFAGYDGNAQVSINSIEVEATGGQIASAALANGALYAGQDLVAAVEEGSGYQAAGNFSSAYLDIGSIHVHAETDSDLTSFSGYAGSAVAGFASGAEYNEVNIEAFVSNYVTQAEASVNIDEITIHAVNNTENNVDHGNDAHAGLAIGYGGVAASGYSNSNGNFIASVDIQAEVSTSNYQQDVHASVDLGSIDIEATAKTGQANAAFAMNAQYSFSTDANGMDSPDVTNPGAFDGEDSYQAIASVAIDALSAGYGDNAIADVTIGNISIEASSYSALNVNDDNFTYGAGAGLAINAVAVHNFVITDIAPNYDITFNADQAFSATNGVVLGSSGFNDGQASVTIDDITIKATSLENTALAAIAGNAFALSDVEINVNQSGFAGSGDGGTQQSITIDTRADANAASSIGARAYDNTDVSTDIQDINVTAISDSYDRAAIAGLAVASRALNTMTVSAYAAGISEGTTDENATANVDIQSSAYAAVSSYLGASASGTSDASLTIQDINITATSNGYDGVALAAMAVSAEASASAVAFARANISGSEGEDSVTETARADADAQASVNALIGAVALDGGVAEVEIGHIDIEATGHYATAAIGALAFASASASATEALGGVSSAYATAYATVDVQIGAFATNEATANLDIASISLEATATTNGTHTGKATAALANSAHATADTDSVSGDSNSYAEVGAGIYARAVGNDANVNVNIGYSEIAPLSLEEPSVGISLIADNLANGDASAFLAGSADDRVYGYISSYASSNGSADLSIGTLRIEATAANGDAVAAIAASASDVSAVIVASAFEGRANLTIQEIHMEATSLRSGDAIANLVANDFDSTTARFAAEAFGSGEATLTINDGITMKAHADAGTAIAGMYDESLSGYDDAVMQSLAEGSGAISRLSIGGDINISAYAKMTATASISAIQAFADDGQANITLGGNVHIAATSTADDAFADASIQAIAIDGGVAHINGNTDKDVSISANGHEVAKASLLIGAAVSDDDGLGNGIASITLGDINVTSDVTAQREDSFSHALLGIAATVGEDSNGSATITAGDITVRAGAESGNTFAGLDVYASAYLSGSDYQHASFHLGNIAITNSATMTGYQDPGFNGNLDLNINNYDGSLSTVGNIEINLGANLTGYADIGDDSTGDAHTIGFGNVEINLGSNSDMNMVVNQEYVTSTASRDLTITGATGADMELTISGDAVDDNEVPGATASYGFTNINLDNYNGSFDLVVNDAGNVVVDGNVSGITFGTGIAGNIYDGRELGISHLTISGFGSQDTITFDFDLDTDNDVNVDSGGRNNFEDISDGTASTDLGSFWSGIQSAMIALDNEAPGGFVYDEFNESGAGGGIDINGDGDSNDSIGVLAYGNTSGTGGITSVIFLENPLTHILASQIYADSYELV
jgi:hypothetical protein